MKKFNKILLPTDFSEYSLTAIEYAVDLADKYDAELHVLHVLEKTPPILAIRSFDLSEEKIISSLENDANASLKKVEERLKSITGRPINMVLRKGIDYQEIVEYCNEEKIDLIVIATHGRTGILHTLLGSVAEKVIRYAKCPVMVVTPREQ